MELFILGLIIGGLVVWAYTKYLNIPDDISDANIVKTEQKVEQEPTVNHVLDINKDGQVNIEDAKAVVKRTRKKAITTPQ